jgi:trimethylamine:corrinoid methyltransferase-like protein
VPSRLGHTLPFSFTLEGVGVRPTLDLLDASLVSQIVSEGVGLLSDPGVAITDSTTVSLLTDHGAVLSPDGARVCFPESLVERALGSAPSSFELFSATGERALDLGSGGLHFTPGSAALTVLDSETRQVRTPSTADYVAYAKVVSQLPDIASQSTALIPGDVHEDISDSYRLFLSLLLCAKPVVTGTFTPGGFAVMRDLQLAVRGTEAELAAKPLTIFTCCPTSPLSWSDEAVGPLLECARAGIPVEVVSMPLTGFLSPVTLVGTLVQHTAEVLSGIVIAQLVNPGTPVSFGASSGIFDVRHGTTPVSAVESMMLSCACGTIGKSLGLPTQAYITLSDAKLLDAQAGLETGMGASLAALSDLDQCSGPGMLDFETCQSLEKLVLDHEICGMALRLRAGITEREDFPARPHAQELLTEGHLMISEHSRRHLRAEHFMPGRIIDRAPRQRWEEDGAPSLAERAGECVRELIDEYEPYALSTETRHDLQRVMHEAAERVGQDRLPELSE